MREGSTDTGAITLARTGDATSALTVSLLFTAGTAVAADLQSVPTETTFAAGASTTTVSLTVVDDAIEEDDETFTIGIATGAGYEIGYPASVQLTIAGPTGTLLLNTLVEGSIGFSGDRDRYALAITTEGLYRINVLGSGASGAAYTLSYGRLRLLAADGVTEVPYGGYYYSRYDGQITAQLQPGTYIVEVAGSGDYYTGTYGLRAGLAPPVITISARDAQLLEGSTAMGAIALARTGDTANALTVSLSFTAGTAVAADLQSVPTEATFAAGASTTTVFLTAVDDAIEEDDEAFTIGIAPGTGYEAGYYSSVRISIAGPTGTLPLNTLVESSIGFSGDRDRYALTITTEGLYRIDQWGFGTSGAQYTLIYGRLRLLAADGVTVVAYGGYYYSDYDGQITAKLQPGTYIVEVAGSGDSSTGTYGLRASLAPPIIKVATSDAQLAEGAIDTVAITLTRTGDTTNSLTVSLSFTAGTAVAADLLSVPAEAVFAAGFSTNTIIVKAVEDGIQEEDEIFTLGIAAGVGYEAGSPSSVAMVISGPAGALSLNSVVEGSIEVAGDRDRYVLTIPSEGVYRIEQLGRGDDSAKDTLRYGSLRLYAADGVSLIAANAGFHTHIDALLKPGTYLVEMAGYGDFYTGTYGLLAALAPAIEVSVAVSDSVLTEGPTDTGTVVLTRTGDTTNPLTVSLSFSAGTANSADLQSIPTEATFLAGSSTTAVSLTAVDDNVAEDDEIFTIGVTAGSGYTVSQQASVGMYISGPTRPLPLNVVTEDSIVSFGDRDRFTLTIVTEGMYQIDLLGYGGNNPQYTLWGGGLGFKMRTVKPWWRREVRLNHLATRT